MTKLKNSSIKTYPLINLIQKITIYETIHSFYIIGSNSPETWFKVIKIDRTCDPKSLAYSEDLHEYDEDGIKDLISMINIDNQSGNKLTGMNTGIIKTYLGFVLLGFIKFLEGYYMILVTKQIPVAILGYHVIYTIDDVAMIYIPYTDKTQNQKEINLDEQKYLKMFQSIDLRQNFYYSFSYDLTNTLQQNLFDISADSSSQESTHVKLIGARNKPCSKFLWNEFLLKPIVNKVSYQWIVYLIHGYLSQSNLNIFGCTVFVTLIARRSQKYAGTRFLKRGGTNEGYVANEVETEQIVHNASISSFEKGYFTSFVHIRGSIPLFWSQDPKAVPKPPINIDIVDPFATVASRHFKQLLGRFGAPIIILNLVKMREKKAQESILADEYKLCLDYLKQFLPNDNFLEYICFDMAKLNKTDKGNVMNRLYDIAEYCIKRTCFFKNFSKIENSSKNFTLQTGTVRVNCVDCLDRTNTAMYVIGKCALAHQLHSLGIISSDCLSPESICERMLIDLYEKCGDAIAQQYGGSQLVHRVDTYGKNSIASQSRDMIHTISRYYSNAFADADKQNAMNIFLGIFEPCLYNFHIWDLASDSYLHDNYIMQPWKLSKKYIEWFDSKIFKCLPLPYEIEFKNLNDFKYIEQLKSKSDPKISLYDNFYKPNQYIAFHEIFYFNNLNTNRITNLNANQGYIKAIFDPFRSKKKTSNPSLNMANNKNTNNYTPGSLASSSEDDLTDDSYSYIQDFSIKPTISKERLKATNQTITNFPNFNNIEISEKSMNMYKNYAEEALRYKEPSNGNVLLKNQKESLTDISISSYSIISFHNKTTTNLDQTLNIDQNLAYKKYSNLSDSQLNSDPIKLLSEKDLSIYLNHINVSLRGACEPNENSFDLYKNFVVNTKIQN